MRYDQLAIRGHDGRGYYVRIGKHVRYIDNRDPAECDMRQFEREVIAELMPLIRIGRVGLSKPYARKRVEPRGY